MLLARAAGFACLAAPWLLGCGGGVDDPRAAEIAAVIARADEPLIRSRPALVAGKYDRMAEDPFSFYRGELALFLHDWERGAYGLSASAFTPVASPLPLSLGDPHPENFGVLIARDGSFGLEPNDFDSADRGPYLWDVRRLVVGMDLAARLSNPTDLAAQAKAVAAARTIARAAAEAYAKEIAALAKGAPRERISDPGGEPVLVDAFKRSKRDTGLRVELTDLTEMVNGKRRLKRGIPDPTSPTNTLGDLPADPYAALPAALAAYRTTLIKPPPPEFFTLLDGVREYGSGVASWPRIRAILLVRGPTDDPGDDVLLEIKELADAELLPQPPPSVDFDDISSRLLGTTRAAWAMPDSAPLWGATTWEGLPFQVRLEATGQKTIRTSRLEGDRGTPEAIAGLGAALGRLLARAHAAPLAPGDTPAARIAASIGADVAAFADEQASLAEVYGPQVLADHALFVKDLADLGHRLGVPADDRDVLSPDAAAFVGAPLAPPPGP